jgi:hypothetical protein
VSVRCEADHTRASRRQLACGVFLKGRPHEEIRLPTHIGSGIGRSRCCCQLVRCYQPHRPNRSCWPKSIPALAIAAPQLPHRREDSTTTAGAAGGREESGQAGPYLGRVISEGHPLTRAAGRRQCGFKRKKRLRRAPSTPSNRAESGRHPFSDVEASHGDDRGPPTLRTTVLIDWTGRKSSRTLTAIL